MNTDTPGDDQALRAAYRAERARPDGRKRHRDIAQAQGVGEGRLIAAFATDAQGEGPIHARPLKPEWPQIIAALPTVGTVMALTRNESCVHEKTGRYEEVSGDGPVGLVLGPDIDLRVFYRPWAHGFAVDEATARGPQRSLQFFDAAGMALHKIFVKPGTDLAAWDALIARFAAPAGAPGAPFVAALPPPKADRPDAEIDQPGLHAAWASLRDTHDFFGMLRRFEVGRVQALRLAEPRFARPVDLGSARELLQAVVSSGTSIMVFVGNPGMIQIHSGAVKRFEVLGPWLNILDPGFNLHLREDHIAQAWVVRKPTVDGLVTSLELFDAQGETIAMFFGERKPGKPELAAWRKTVEQLVADPAWNDEAAACAAC